MAKRNKNPRQDFSQAANKGKAEEPFNSALAGLAALKAQLGGSEEPSPPAVEAPPAKAVPASSKSGPELLRRTPKLVLSREKKGRGGKTVTILKGLDGSAEELKAFAKQLKKHLGCGAQVEEELIVLQGAQGERAQSYLLSLGAKKVVLGN